MKLEDIFEDITPQELYTVERFANDLFNKLGVDVQFSAHFVQRVNDPRNKPGIYVDDLIDMFRKEYQQHGKDLAQLPGEAQGVLRDAFTKLNLPFVITQRYGGKTLLAKSTMRKKVFGTTSKMFTV